MMFGFAPERRRLLEEEFLRVAGAMTQLGAERLYLTGDLAHERVTRSSELAVVIVLETEVPAHRRSDFFVTHLRPRVGTRFHIYTPAEFEERAGIDPVLRSTLEVSDPIDVG